MLAVVAHRASETNAALVAAAARLGPAELLGPSEALVRLRPGDVAVGRLDVRPSLDGIEAGVWALAGLSARGVCVLNGPSTLLAAHDKLQTAHALAKAALPHPATTLLLAGEAAPEPDAPVVLKPRFGSWGRDVVRCRDRAELERALTELRQRSWFRTQGALVQELVPPQGYDLRLLVAGGEVVGAIRRHAAPGEWRTNVALGGRRVRAEAPADACAVALAAAAAIEGDLVGVDLLPSADGWVVIELNGAVDFTRAYAHTRARDVFSAAAVAIARTAAARLDPRPALALVEA